MSDGSAVSPCAEKPAKSTFASLFKRKEKILEVSREQTIREINDTEMVVPQNEEAASVSFSDMFRFSTKFELLLNGIGLVAAVAAGAGEPLMSLIFGNLTNAFVAYQQTLQSSDPATAAQAGAQFIHTVSLDACWLVLIGGTIMISTYYFTYAWNYTGESTSKRVRELYFESVLRQDIAYFDKVGAGAVTTHIETDTHLFQQGVSEKNAFVVRHLASFVTGFVLAYAIQWRLALVLTTIIPCVVITGSVMAILVSRCAKQALGHVSEGSSIAEEVLSSIRTAQAFGSQNVLAALYNAPIQLAHNFELKSATVSGIGISIFLFIVYSEYALAFIYGTTLVIDQIAQVGTIVNVISAILFGSFSLSQLAAEMQPIILGRAAAAKLYETIDRKPEIDSQSKDGKKPTSVQGEIKLENVSFNYPSRPDVTVARNLDLHFPAGKTVALVGASGSGKSTVVSLVERFYDPLGGRVTLDGVDIRELNIKWLRSQISLVSQEPVLFKDTIATNVAYGLIGTAHEDVSYEEKLKLVKEACIKANADFFISKLPEGYETHVGERGYLLSGGQKQRIAIARAIVSDPKILLLDEATSALDTQSEGVVQDALDNAAAGRTTITIAHRLSTIKGADKIYVMGQGTVLEEGTHEELLRNPEGPYSKLVEAQKLRESSRQTIYEIDRMDDGISFDEEHKEMQPDGLVYGSAVVEQKTYNQSLVDFIVQKETNQDNGSIFRLFIRICEMERSLVKQYLVGAILACLQGTVFPAFGIVMGQAINAFSTTDSGELRFEEDRNGLWFFIIALLSMFIVGGEHLHMGRASANVMNLLRRAQFKAMLRQDIQYFDEDGHSTGVLVSKLSDNPQKINGLLGTTAATILQSISTLISGWIVALIFNWKLGLVGIACEPFIVTAGFIRLKVIATKDKQNEKAHEESAQFACEAASAIRTIASLTREENCVAKYSETLNKPLQRSLQTALWANALFAFTQSTIFYVLALLFWFGATQIVAGDLSNHAFFVVIFSIVFACSEAGAIWQHAPDISSASSAARDVNNLLSSVPEIDTESKKGSIPRDARGNISLDKVEFRYPTRPGVQVLRGLSLKVEPGSYVALVGASGCGKSTVIQLLERFYNPTAGKILLDDQDISQLNVQEYRKNIALVSQEPTLYAGSIRFNILLGATKSESEVTEKELEDACRNANILDFITSLPNGFDTNVGGKGSQLSGGQKQRIAIARALIRNPKVLLLDEATSALDSNSEKVVQEALDKAAKGRTTIAIAHRLSTIQNADRIYFIKDGQVSECGTHDELLALRGEYFEYVRLQTLSKS